MLEIRQLEVAYGAIQVLHGVSLDVASGTTAAVLGANGAGKSSLLRAISGVAPIKSGSIFLAGKDITYLSANERAKLGIAHAMKGRRLFKQLSVESNLRLAWEFGARKVPWDSSRDEVYARFPILAEKAQIPAGLLSGGQQQMVIISCTTIRSPVCVLFDEPSLGLAPIIVTQIYNFISSYAERSGSAILLAEQMAALALKISDYAYVLRRGRIVQQGRSCELVGDGRSQSLSASYL